MIKGVIFDLDGTLVDSPLDFARIRKEIGCDRGLVLEFIDSLPSPRREECHGILLGHELRAADEAVLKRGAFELCRFIEEAGLKKALVTRNCRAAVGIVCTRLGLKFDVVICREDAPPKPSPEPLLKAARAMGLEPAALLHVGDTSFDHEAAERAGVRSFVLKPGSREPHAIDSLLQVMTYLREENLVE